MEKYKLNFGDFKFIGSTRAFLSDRFRFQTSELPEYSAHWTALLKKHLDFYVAWFVQLQEPTQKGESVPGGSKFYILGWNLQIMLLMEAVEDRSYSTKKGILILGFQLEIASQAVFTVY